ncbi:MAG: hypothetical protein JNK82_01830 [Myxococcaceae bacterium]|nr:hypothetical protein [Myxococcaceae bacterium]
MLALIVAALTAQTVDAGSPPSPHWVVSLDTGETLTLIVEWQKGAVRAGRARGTWSKGKKSLDKGEWLVTGSGGERAGSSGGANHVTLERIITEAEENERTDRLRAAMSGPQQQALVQKRAQATAKLSACMAQNQNNSKHLSQCMAPVQAELNALQVEQDQRIRKARSGPKAGCELLELEVENGKVKGSGDRCTDGASHPVTGTASL